MGERVWTSRRARTAGRTTSWAVSALALSAAAALSPASAQQVDLVAELRSGDSTRCMEAGNVADEYKEQAAQLAPAIFELIESGHGCAGSALSALVNLGDGIAASLDAERAVPVLTRLIEEGIEPSFGDPVHRGSSALFVIGRFGEEAAPALPTIERWIRERPDEHDKRYGLMAIADLGDAATPAAPLLIELLGPDPDDDSYSRNEMRLEAARTLARLPALSALAADELVAALSSEDWTLRSLAADALAAGGPEVVPALLTELDSGVDERREEAVRILGTLGEDARDAAPILAKLLVDDNWTVQYEAGNLLETLGPDERVIELLAAMLRESKNEDAVTRAAEILGSYGPAAASAVPALRHAITRESWSVTQAAEDAIEKIEGGG